ncbi:4Fe-4S binding protein [Candidatus Woesearchaeota archaeon]|nr:4Fe-4S binding protein [Candidatus Woesearchaeota archaeon]
MFWLLVALLSGSVLAVSDIHSEHTGHVMPMQNTTVNNTIVAEQVVNSGHEEHTGHVMLAQEPVITGEQADSGGHDHSSMVQEKSPIVTGITFVLASILLIGFIFFFRGLAGKDLLEFSIINKLMKSRAYPLMLQIPTFIFFIFIFYFFFFGSLSYSRNPGSILAWTLWWPLVPLTFILFGRIWCVICPLPIIGDFVQKFIHPARRPGRFLVKYGIWITDGIFIAITLFDRLYGMVDTPWLSGSVFVLILFGVVIISATYERRTFCKHICFLGGVSGNYSMLSGISIETKNPEVCATCKAKACFFGSGKAPGCPYFSTMPAKAGMRNCNLCASCIKNCPNDNIALKARSIASELWSHAKVSFSESFFAKLMVGIVIIQNLGMLAVWSDLQRVVMGWGFGEKVAITILYFAAIAIPLLLMSITSFISSRLQSVKGSTASNFAAFGYAFIPIDVAGHLAHNLFHLLAEGKSIIGAFAGLVTGKVAFEGALASSPVISGLQFALIGVGGIGTLYVAYRIALVKEGSVLGAIKIVLPHTLLLLVIIGINIFLFSTPMAHRGG